MLSGSMHYMRCVLQGGLVCMVVMYREIYEQTHVN